MGNVFLILRTLVCIKPRVSHRLFKNNQIVGHITYYETKDFKTTNNLNRKFTDKKSGLIVDIS